MATCSPFPDNARFESFPAQTTSFLQRQAFDALFVEVYELLRRRASILSSRENSPTHRTGALLNALYLEMVRNPAYALMIASRGKIDFLAVAGEAMKRALIDSARRSDCKRRGGGYIFTGLTAANGVAKRGMSPEDLLALQDSIEKLRSVHPRRAKMIELRFYAGLTVAELRTYFGVADSTVENDLRCALKFLNVMLKSKRQS